MDRDHRVAEAVELVLRFALGRLDHERVGDREGQGRGVKPDHQTLRHVLGGHTAGLFQLAQVEDALVRHAAAPV